MRPQPCHMGIQWKLPPMKKLQGAKTASMARTRAMPRSNASTRRVRQPIRGLIGRGGACICDSVLDNSEVGVKPSVSQLFRHAAKPMHEPLGDYSVEGEVELEVGCGKDSPPFNILWKRIAQ